MEPPVDPELLRQTLRPILYRGRISTQEAEVLRFTLEPHLAEVIHQLLGTWQGRISRKRGLEVLLNLADAQGLRDYIRRHKVPRKSLRHQLQICLAEGYYEDIELLRPLYRWPLHHQLQDAVYCGQPAMIELALSDYSYPGSSRSRKALADALETAVEYERLEAIAMVAPLCVREKLPVPSRSCLRNYLWSRSNSDDPLLRLLNYPLPGLVPRLLRAAFARSRWSLWYKICDTEPLLGRVDQKLLQHFLRVITGRRSGSLEHLEALSSLLEALKAPYTFPNLEGPPEAYQQLKDYNVHAPSLELCLYFHKRLKAAKISASKKDAASTAVGGCCDEFGVYRSPSAP